MTGLMGFALGWCTGVLTLMQLQVAEAWWARRRHPTAHQLRHPDPFPADEWDGSL